VTKNILLLTDDNVKNTNPVSQQRYAKKQTIRKNR